MQNKIISSYKLQIYYDMKGINPTYYLSGSEQQIKTSKMSIIKKCLISFNKNLNFHVTKF